MDYSSSPKKSGFSKSREVTGASFIVAFEMSVNTVREWFPKVGYFDIGLGGELTPNDDILHL